MTRQIFCFFAVAGFWLCGLVCVSAEKKSKPAGADKKEAKAKSADVDKKVTDSEQNELAEGQTANSIGMKFVKIPAGEFVMGSPKTETKGRDDHEDQVRVRISKPFEMGVYEVTQSEFQKVMGINPSQHRTDGRTILANLKGINTDRFPVETVTWYQATEFCEKLSKLSEEQDAGRTYRLPTEAEWEYACRAGTQTPFHFGSVLDGTDANCDGKTPYGTNEKGPRLFRTTTVGSYKPNAFGLYDMHGNVREICSDWYSFSRKIQDVTDPQGPSVGNPKLKVVKGGSWYLPAVDCRSAKTVMLPLEGVMINTPLYRNDNTGFRVVCITR